MCSSYDIHTTYLKREVYEEAFTKCIVYVFLLSAAIAARLEGFTALGLKALMHITPLSTQVGNTWPGRPTDEHMQVKNTHQVFILGTTILCSIACTYLQQATMWGYIWLLKEVLLIMWGYNSQSMQYVFVWAEMYVLFQKIVSSYILSLIIYSAPKTSVGLYSEPNCQAARGKICWPLPD